MQSQTNIFYSETGFKPLAELMRPEKIEDLVGDIKNNLAFINWLKHGVKQSALLWGPPGTGKTTIAHLAAQISGREVVKLQAFNSGVKDLREVIERAERIPNSIILFVDEVHNFNKNQQDVLLNAVEKGVLVFIGATTENPAISINRAILSRSLKFELKPHNYEDLQTLLQRALELKSKTITEDASEYIIHASNGDARVLLNNLEQVFTEDDISLELAQRIINKQNFAGDANTYYDCISALQKSLRGSDPDASIYWLARLLDGGAELEAVARRILVTASEDVGIADSQALVIANAAYDAALKLGMPEARIPLAQAVVYIARAPKSNVSYKAINKAMEDCYKHPPYPVPHHLRSINLKDCPAKSNNTGTNPQTGYKYPHDYPGNWIKQEYLPDELKGKQYYHRSEA